VILTRRDLVRRVITLPKIETRAGRRRPPKCRTVRQTSGDASREAYPSRHICTTVIASLVPSVRPRHRASSSTIQASETCADRHDRGRQRVCGAHPLWDHRRSALLSRYGRVERRRVATSAWRSPRTPPRCDAPNSGVLGHPIPDRHAGPPPHAPRVRGSPERVPQTGFHTYTNACCRAHRRMSGRSPMTSLSCLEKCNRQSSRSMSLSDSVGLLSHGCTDGRHRLRGVTALARRAVVVL
jgi:hypothetical protein